MSAHFGSEQARRRQEANEDRCRSRRRTGVICETWALEAAVIPAKAGIYSANLPQCAVDGLDSRFRGNDRRFEKDPIPNDTTRPGRTPGRNLKRSLTEIPLGGKTQKEDSNG